MSRKIIQLAGSTFLRIKSLSGADVLKDREVVISKDTSELVLGNSDGSFNIVSNLHIGLDKNEMNSIDPVKGRFFYNETRGLLYAGNGTKWKKVGILIPDKSGLILNEETNELKVKVDEETMIINSDGALETNNADYGVF